MRRWGSVRGFVARLLALGLAELGMLGAAVLCGSTDPRARLGGALVATASAGLCLVVVYLWVGPQRTFRARVPRPPRRAPAATRSPS